MLLDPCPACACFLPLRMGGWQAFHMVVPLALALVPELCGVCPTATASATIKHT